MRRTRVAIDAPVLATAIWIDTGLETDVRAVVVRNDCLRVISEKLRSEQRLILFRPFRIRFNVDFLEPVRRILRRAASGNG